MMIRKLALEATQDEFYRGRDRKILCSAASLHHEQSICSRTPLIYRSELNIFLSINEFVHICQRLPSSLLEQLWHKAVLPRPDLKPTTTTPQRGYTSIQDTTPSTDIHHERVFPSNTDFVSSSASSSPRLLIAPGLGTFCRGCAASARRYACCRAFVRAN